MTVLITGGNGRFARAIASELSDDARFRLADDAFDDPAPDSAERLAGDICDPGFLREAVSGVDAIVHLSPIASSGLPDSEAMDRATRGSYAILKAAVEAGVMKFILGSTLDLFDRLPSNWRVAESWKPRPAPVVSQMAAMMSELTLREFHRMEPIHATILRFGRIVTEEEIARSNPDSRWLHLEDAVQGVRRALAYESKAGLRIYHIAAAGCPKVRVHHASHESFGYHPAHAFDASTERDSQEAGAPWSDLLAPTHPISSRPIRNVVLFGAGGPLGCVVTSELSGSYRLRLADLRSLEEIAALPPQSHGSPMPSPVRPPHEFRKVDVTDGGQVMAACEGMDAIINLSVVREDPATAFRVNALGAYHIARAAVAHRIRRVVQTGPQLTEMRRGEYELDFDIPSDAPPRAHTYQYTLSKYLGQEILRIYAEAHDLEVSVLLFTAFVNPETAHPGHLYPFSVTWEDSARAVRRALEAGSLPSPYEVFNILGDLPTGKYDNRKPKEILDWVPRDDLARLWTYEEEG